jgi:hypothetical protein
MADRYKECADSVLGVVGCDWWEMASLLDDAEQSKDQENDEDCSQPPDRIVTPAGAVGPSRQRADH